MTVDNNNSEDPYLGVPTGDPPAPPVVEGALSSVEYPAIYACDAVNGARWLALGDDGKVAQQAGSEVIADYLQMYPDP